MSTHPDGNFLPRNLPHGDIPRAPTVRWSEDALSTDPPRYTLRLRIGRSFEPGTTRVARVEYWGTTDVSFIKLNYRHAFFNAMVMECLRKMGYVS